MSKLAQRVERMNLSATLAMTHKARELAAKGHHVINLSIGEPDFNPPEFVQEAAIEGMRAGYNSYTPVPGLPELRQAICAKLLRDNHLSYSSDQIVVSNGAKQAITNVFLALLNPGDQVIIPAPYWVSYAEMVKLAEGEPIIISSSIVNDYKITPEQLKSAISAKTKAFIFSSPCNPSGSIYSLQELEALAQVFRQHPDIIVISDEIYEHIRYVHEYTSIASLDGMLDRTVTINGMSKAFAMTGWRIGYAAAPLWLSKACIKIQGQTTSGANSTAQYASIKALESPIANIQYMLDAFSSRRELILSLAKDIDGFICNDPKGAFYIFPDISPLIGSVLGGNLIQSGDDLAMYLLMNAHVATVGGNDFGSPNCIRISYAANETDLKEAFSRIKKALSA